MAACGELVRTSLDTFIKGFFCNLGPCNSIRAELWALRLAIKLARNLSLSPMQFELDSQVVVHMIRMGNSHNKFLQPLLLEVIELLNKSDWRTSVTHVFREANRCADFLANRCHSSSFTWTVFDRAMPSLALILREDALDVSIPRVVA